MQGARVYVMASWLELSATVYHATLRLTRLPSCGASALRFGSALALAAAALAFGAGFGRSTVLPCPRVFKF